MTARPNMKGSAMADDSKAVVCPVDDDKPPSEYTWEDAARDLALLTHWTHSETLDLVKELRSSKLEPYWATPHLKSLINMIPATHKFNPWVLGGLLARFAEVDPRG